MEKQKYKIIVVDDSKTFLMYLKGLLDYDFFELELIQDPKDFLEKALSFKPDIILTDLEMPGLSGLDLCKLCQASDKLNMTPIIVLTSSESDSKLISAFSFGAHDFINKTIHKDILFNKIISLAKYKHLIDLQVKKENKEAVSSLVATINHELNNAICISTQFARRLTKTANDVQLKDLEKIIGANKRVTDVVKKLNELESIEKELEHNVLYLKI
jgi:PleD family two-component response regulator